MPDTRVAKLFKNGASQAVRLPADFRFQGAEIYATRDAGTGDVLLSSTPGREAWTAFFELRDSIPNVEDFMNERPLNQIPEERAIFGEDD